MSLNNAIVLGEFCLKGLRNVVYCKERLGGTMAYHDRDNVALQRVFPLRGEKGCSSVVRQVQAWRSGSRSVKYI